MVSFFKHSTWHPLLYGNKYPKFNLRKGLNPSVEGKKHINSNNHQIMDNQMDINNNQPQLVEIRNNQNKKKQVSTMGRIPFVRSIKEMKMLKDLLLLHIQDTPLVDSRIPKKNDSVQKNLSQILRQPSADSSLASSCLMIPSVVFNK